MIKLPGAKATKEWYLELGEISMGITLSWVWHFNKGNHIWMRGQFEKKIHGNR